jgi:predicted DNA-binding transcriptional regulator YafY
MKKNVVPFPSPHINETLDQQLRSAIANKRLIQFTYEGAQRVAEPHDYGIRDGAVKTLVYQRRKGHRQDERARGWRSLEISKIEDCVVLDDTFKGSRAKAEQHHLEWDVLFARVDQTVD